NTPGLARREPYVTPNVNIRETVRREPRDISNADTRDSARRETHVTPNADTRDSARVTRGMVRGVDMHETRQGIPSVRYSDERVSAFMGAMQHSIRELESHVGMADSSSNIETIAYQYCRRLIPQIRGILAININTYDEVKSAAGRMYAQICHNHGLKVTVFPSDVGIDEISNFVRLGNISDSSFRGIIVNIVFAIIHLTGSGAKTNPVDDLHASLRPVIWVRGSMLQHVLGSSAVRVTDNRIRFIPAAWTLITVGSYATESTSCTPHASALCRVSGSELRETLGMGIGSLVFPIDGMGVRVHGNTSHSCKNGKGRISEASDMVEPVYDISVCDVVDGPLDILFIYNRVYVTRVNVDTSLYVATGMLVVVVIVLVTQNLAVDIMSEHSTEESAISTGVCMFLSLALTVCSCILPGVFNGVGPGLFVPISTLLDWYFFYTIVSYMSLHGFIWMCISGWRRLYHFYNIDKLHEYKWYMYSSTRPVAVDSLTRPVAVDSLTRPVAVDSLTRPVAVDNSTTSVVVDSSTRSVSVGKISNQTPVCPQERPFSDGPRVAQLHSVNFMVCALLLSVFSTHGTIETVLTSPLLFVFMFRTIFKSYAIENSFRVVGMSDSYTQVVFEPLLIALDIVVVGAIHVVGTQALAETTMHANTGFAIMLFIAHTLAYEGNRARRNNPVS
ncbi:hypothetical protein T484DRAFT_1757723, partial [Baffinella frigidus]